ncbi:hypothetical protein [Shinella sp.]|uniref:hypothetical protein n=1 Tax=Shinella sp. TaxID=1870904 RepID=UPI002585F0A7|nr:hypothetical protein [Shinella sp.]MCW5711558.1 hypothetical protein [Shinella sp.]
MSIMEINERRSAKGFRTFLDGGRDLTATVAGRSRSAGIISRNCLEADHDA